MQRFAAQPRFTSLYREGDPYAVLSLAAATELGAAPNAALAAVLRRRLAPLRVDVRADGLAIRVTLPLREDAADDLQPTLETLAAALGEPVDPADVEVATAAMASLRERPLSSPGLLPWARCAGVAAALATEARDSPDAAELSKWQRRAFSTERLGLAYVGPAGLGNRVAAALPTSRGWPRGDDESADSWAPASSHDAFSAAETELRVAIRHPDAVAAVGAAQRLGGPSPLGHHLALLDPPWVVRDVGAVAHPRGGCLHVRLTPAVPAETKDGAAAASVAIGELRRALADRPPAGFAATREILAGGSVTETARRAAWWALNEPGQGDSVAVTALALGGLDDDDALAAGYRDALEPAPARVAPEVRTRVEAGQGAYWMIAAQPCALRHEGTWDAGHAALAATALAASAEGDVSIQPWVTPHGIGLIAHAVPREPAEAPAVLAERVGDALGRHLTALPRDEATLNRARAEVMALLQDERAALMGAASEAVAPGHPTWLMPWGLRDRVADASPAAVMGRWRDLLQAGPWRVAVIANVDDAQATAGVEALQRWLPPTPERCAARSEPVASSLEGRQVKSAAPGAVALSVHPIDDLPIALRVAAAAETALDGLGHPHGVELVDGPRPALVFWAEAATVDRKTMTDALQAALRDWAQRGIDDAAWEKAAARLLERGAARRLSPRGRLAELWLGARPTTEADAAMASAWLKRTLARGALIEDG